MTNQQLIDNGHQMMDETDQAIDRAQKVGSSSIYHFIIRQTFVPAPWRC